LRELLRDSNNLVPLAGLLVLAAVGIYFWLRRKPADASEIERQRRAYLSRVGRIVEGQVLDIVAPKEPSASKRNGHGITFFKRNATATLSDSSPKLLYYTYAISGVTYETAQDITGIEERLHLTRIAVGQIASVKYDPSNPSNSILVADDWTGLH
jgi:LPXTG-motif cell wall-anchored protein